MTGRVEGAKKPVKNQLWQLAKKCAFIIADDLEPWNEAAEWLRRLPTCYAIRDRRESRLDEDPDFPQEKRRSGVPVGFGWDPRERGWLLIDDEEEAQRIYGPILRRLTTAWRAATFKYLDRHGSDPMMSGFGTTDAQRIILLTALVACRDFDGTQLGLGYPWDHPSDCYSTFEGRAIVNGLLTDQMTQPEVLGLIREAINYYREWHRVRPATGRVSRGTERPATLDTSPRRRNRTDEERVQDEANIIAHLSKHPDATRDEIARALGLAAGTVSKSPSWRRVSAIA